MVGLLVADLYLNRLEHTRSALDTLVTPFYWLADLPSRLGEWQQNHLVSREVLQEDNQRLRQANLILEGRTQQMASLQAENIRLRALLNSAALLRNDVMIAELIGVSPDPVRHQVVVNKGLEDGVYVGQPLIDANGLMGQVVEVGALASRVILITDATHAIPVQVNRNGVRAVAEGSGSLSLLEVRHVSATTDIQEGDLLVSSGLGGRFPVGYPVAVVTTVERDPGLTFARVHARPTAALDRSRHVLLVFAAATPSAQEP